MMLLERIDVWMVGRRAAGVQTMRHNHAERLTRVDWFDLRMPARGAIDSR